MSVRAMLQRAAALFAAGAPVVVVVAPAGFGKSTAVREWLASAPAVRSAAVDLRRLDLRTPAGIGRALVAAALQLGVPASPGWEGLLVDETRLGDAFVERLAEALAAVRHPFVLVLDDVQLVAEPVVAEFGRLVELVATGAHRLVVVSRMAVPWPLGRWRSSGLCSVVSAVDLVLDERELQQVLGLRPGGRLAEAMASTWGWPAVVDVVRRSLEADPGVEIGVAAFGVVEFVRAEVLPLFDERTERLLCRSSVLSQFPASVAAVVADEPAAQSLLSRVAEPAGLVRRVGGSEFVCHPMLREALRRRLAELEPGSESDRHRLAAAAWLDEPASFETSVNAMEHLLAAHAWPEALELLRRFSGEPFRRSRNDLEVAWLEAIPGRYWEDDLDLAFWYAGAAALVGQGTKGYDRLARLPISSHPGGVAASKISRAHTTWWSMDPVEAVALAGEGERELAALPADVAIPRAPGFQDRVAYAALATFSVGRAHALMGDFDEVIACMSGDLAGGGPRVATMAVSARGTLGWALAMTGDVQPASAAVAAALELADECGLRDHLAAAPAHLAAAVAGDLTGDSDTASAQLEAALRLGEAVSARNFVRWCRAVGATFRPLPGAVHDDDPSGAELPDLPFVRRLAWPARARRLATLGDGPAAERLLRSVEPHELTLAAWVELGLDRVPRHDLHRWVQRRSEPTCVRGRIVHTLALAATSEQDSVMIEHCRQAADLAMPGQLVGVFLDAPRQLLDRLAVQPVDHPLLADVGHTWLATARPVRLSTREMQLLTLLAGSERAAEIADRLCVSLSTVKSHVASVYRKLGVANREAAVARGRQLGLIPGGQRH